MTLYTASTCGGSIFETQLLLSIPTRSLATVLNVLGWNLAKMKYSTAKSCNPLRLEPPGCIGIRDGEQVLDLLPCFG